MTYFKDPLLATFFVSSLLLLLLLMSPWLAGITFVLMATSSIQWLRTHRPNTFKTILEFLTEFAGFCMLITLFFCLLTLLVTFGQTLSH